MKKFVVTKEDDKEVKNKSNVPLKKEKKIEKKAKPEFDEEQKSMVTKRHSKMFKKDKETFEVFTAGQSNYQDKDGKFIECDLCLTADIKGDFVNETNHFKTSFGKSTLEGHLASLERNGHKISMDIVSGNQRRSRGSKCKLLKSHKMISKVQYGDAIDGVDLEYELAQTGIKECIIIKQKQDKYEYQFSLEIGTLTPKFDEASKSLELLDGNKAIYRLKSPFMIDSNHNYSDDCSYEITEESKGILNITLSANAEWVNDASRIFPVTVDPTIEVVNEDVFTLVGKAKIKNMWWDNFEYFIGIPSYDQPLPGFISECQIEIHIDCAAIKESIENRNFKAILNLYVADTTAFFREHGIVVFSCDGTILHRKTSLKTNDVISLDISFLIKNNNDAIIINATYESDSTADPGQEGSYLTIAPFNSIDEYKIPELIISYIDEEVEEITSKTHEYPVGVAGTTSVNLFNGSLKHIHSDASINHNRLSLGLNHLFDSKAEDSVSRTSSTFMGKGWKNNFHQFLIKSESFNKLLGSKDITYIDGRNVKHYLHQQWYYLDDEKVKHYIERKDMFLDDDQKIKYADLDGIVREVKFDIKSEENLQYISGMDLTSYKTEGRTSKKYYAVFGFGKREIDVNDQELHLQYYYYSNGHKIYLAPHEIVRDENGHISTNSNNGRNVCIDLEYTTQIVKNLNGTLNFKYKVLEDQSAEGTPIFGTHTNGEIEIIETIEEQNDILDLYSNENIEDLTSQIKEIKLYLEDLNTSKSSIQKSYSVYLKQCAETVIQLDLQKKLQEKTNYIEQKQQTLIGAQNTFNDAIGNDAYNSIAGQVCYDKNDNAITEHFNINASTLDVVFGNVDMDKEAAIILSKFANYFQRQSNISASDLANTLFSCRELTKQIKELDVSNALKSMENQIENYENEKIKISNSIRRCGKQLEELLRKRDSLIEEQYKRINDFIIDNDGNRLGFDGYGRLIRIQDIYENKIEVEFGDEDENEGQMLSIFTETQKIKFHYDKENRLLKSITDTEGRKTKYAYDENEQLISLTYNDGKKTTFAYNEFSVTSPSLERSVIVKLDDESISVRSYRYDGIIGESTIFNGNENVKKIIDHKYSFDRDYLSTTIEDDYTKEEVVYSFDSLGRIVKQVGKELTNVAFYEQDNLKSEVSYKTGAESLLRYLTIHDGPTNYQINLGEFRTSAKNKLPPSNMIGLLIEVLTGQVDNAGILSFKVKATVHTTKKDGTLKQEIFEQEYQEIKLQTLVLPICIDRDLSYQLDIAITSDSDDFHGTYFAAVDLIKLEDGKVCTYDSEDRLIKEQNGFGITTYEEFNEDDIPLKKSEMNIFGDELITTYNLNRNKQVTYMEDSKGNVQENYYDEKGQQVETRSYNKLDASLMRAKKTIYDEAGRVISSNGPIKDKDGTFPKEEATYLPNTNSVSKVKGVNGETTTATHDFNNGNLLSISSSASGINNSTAFTYNYGLLTSMSHHGMKVRYTYDGQGRRIDAFVNDESIPFLRQEYVDNYSSLGSGFDAELNIRHGAYQKAIMKNGVTSETFVDDRGLIRKNIVDTAERVITRDSVFDDEKRLTLATTSIQEGSSNSVEVIDYVYNDFGKVTDCTKEIDGEFELYLAYEYDEKQRVTNEEICIQDGEVSEIAIHYDEKDNVDSLNIDETIFFKQEFDTINRVNHQEVKVNKISLCHEYSYLQQDENTLDLIAEDITKIKIQRGYNTEYLTETATYEYDVDGNITSIVNDESEIRYQYDKLNRLIREDNPLLNKTIVYKYDKAGNILLKKTYPYSLNDNLYSPFVDEYVYDCEKGRDRLISFNGKAIEYNEDIDMGRPTTYKDDEFEWSKRGELTYILNQEMGEFEYFYNADGIRNKKIINGEETSFVLDGTKILQSINGNKVITFRYALSKLIGFCYNNKEFIYERNIQGDIIRIIDEDGNIVGEYAYDGYGNHIVITDINGIASLNPFRYRGYFYDCETRLYYLNARYYDPETGRFISPDILTILDETKGQINGLNLYMYCGNNPVMNVDPTGYDFWDVLGKVIKAILIVGAVALVVAAGIATCGAAWAATAGLAGILAVGLTTLAVTCAVVGTAVIGAAIINFYTLIETEIYVATHSVKLTASELAAKYEKMYTKRESTVGLSRKEKLEYIAYVRLKEKNIRDNWTVGQMLREFEYHDRLYSLVKLFGASDDNFPAENLKHVDFETVQNWKTYLFRVIGNIAFW